MDILSSLLCRVCLEITLKIINLHILVITQYSSHNDMYVCYNVITV